MPRNGTKAVAKSNLPTKICPTCQRPFTWRKKWEKVWNDVRFCSQRCKSGARNQA